MLDNILFIDHSVVSIEYNEGDSDMKVGGSFEYSVESENNIKITTEAKDGKLHFRDAVNISVVANNNDDKSSLAFLLKIKMQLIYEYPESDKDEFTEKFLNDNIWFFKNFSHQAAHSAVISILNQTRFRSVNTVIPRYRIS